MIWIIMIAVLKIISNFYVKTIIPFLGQLFFELFGSVDWRLCTWVHVVDIPQECAMFIIKVYASQPQEMFIWKWVVDQLF
ncbi:hypothetical protein BK635_03620 [Pseudomonas chlororaphis]|nr:hypothetical protein BK635_03620 [Pseudomonas chlororaphis]